MLSKQIALSRFKLHSFHLVMLLVIYERCRIYAAFACQPLPTLFTERITYTVSDSTCIGWHAV